MLSESLRDKGWPPTNNPNGEARGPTLGNPGTSNQPVEAAVEDPHRLAAGFLQMVTDTPGIGEVPTPRHWRGEWYEWRDGHYARVDDTDLRARIVTHIKKEFDAEYYLRRKVASDAKPVRSVTRSLVGDVLQALASVANLPSHFEAPGWIAPGIDWPLDETILAQNAMIHLPLLLKGENTLAVRPPSPKLFSTGTLGARFLQTARAPEWGAFLTKLWPKDPDSINTLQEWFGYCLTTDTSQHKILMVIGPPRSGKGTICRILQSLLGEQNTCAPALSSLGSPFGLQPLLGKTLATITDARLSGRADLAMVTERLLSISGEDAQTIDRKHLLSLTVRLPLRFMILSNELPALRDSSSALARRLIVLQQTESWYGREDRRLCLRLKKELSGILNWSIQGWKRLHERGHFEQPKSALELVGQMEDLSSPIGAFISERCIVGLNEEVDRKVLYEEWRKWSEQNGYKVTTRAQFGRDLSAAVPNLDRTQPRTESGRRSCYSGISLQPENVFG
jgi:putative DNA primase/helicase